MGDTVSPLESGRLLLFLLQVGVLLLAARLLGRLALRLNLPRLVGELLAGVLLGPTVLGNVLPALSRGLFPADPGQGQLLDVIAQLGVLLLVALSGAQLDGTAIQRHSRAALCVSLGGLVVPLGLGILTGLLLPGELVPPGVAGGVFALLVGVAMCATAVPVVARVLMELELLHRTVGQLTMTAAVVDDTVGWLLLAVVASLVTGHAGASLARMLPVLVGLVAAAVLLDRWARHRLRLAGNGPDGGSSTALAVIVVLGCAAASAAGGFEPFLGSVLAGFAVLRHIAPERLAPLRTVVVSVLTPVFLATIGLRVDLTELRRPVVLASALAVVAVAVVGKFAGVYAGARLSRISRTEAVALGIGMNTRGMVEVVIALVGLRLGVLSPAMFTVIILLAVATSVGVPGLLRAVMRRVPVGPSDRAGVDVTRSA